MAQPSGKLTNEELRKGLAEGEFEGRKAAVAEEILRQRSEERTQEWSKKFGWIGGIVVALLLWLRLRFRSRRTET